MNLNPYHPFSHDDRIYLINTEKMTAIEINEDIAALLEFVSNNPELAVTPESESEIGRLELANYENSPSREKVPGKAILVTHIALFITQECNLKCTYCYVDGGNYGSGGDMTREVAFRSVNWLIEQSKDMKKLDIAFFGGEPLLNFTLMKEVVQYAQKRGEESCKEFGFNITTNASLLNNEMITFLKENKIKPLISFDGPKEIQDTQRPFKNGKRSSYDVIAPKIKKLLEILPDSQCRATIVGSTNLLAVDKALSEIGFRSKYLTAVSWPLFNNNDTPLPNRDLAGMFNRAEAEAQDLLTGIKERNLERLNGLKDSGVLFFSLEGFVNGQKRFFPCGAGRSHMAVSCSGDVYLCHRFVGSKAHRLGNIFSGDLDRDIYQTSALQFQDECKNCFAKYLCAGGCYHDNLGTTGSIFEPNKDMCALMRCSVELAAVICSQLSDDDKTYLVKEKIIVKKTCPFDLF